MSRFEVAPGEVEDAAVSLRGMGADAEVLGSGGCGALGGGGLSGSVEAMCARAQGLSGALHAAAETTAAGLGGGAAGYERAERSAMPGAG